MKKINYRVNGTKPPFLVQLLQAGALVASKEHATTGEGEEFSFSGIEDNLYSLRVTDNMNCVHMVEVNMLPVWKPTGHRECVKADGVNTGEVMVEERDQNPYSSSYNTLHMVSGGVDLTTCPLSNNDGILCGKATFSHAGDPCVSKDEGGTLTMGNIYSYDGDFNNREMFYDIELTQAVPEGSYYFTSELLGERGGTLQVSGGIGTVFECPE